MYKFWFFAVSIFLGVFFFSLELSADSICPFDEEALVSLEDVKDPAILGVQDEIVYLNPEKIIVGNEGIFFATSENLLLKLDFLSSDELGIYTRPSKLGRSVGTVWPAVIKCQKCGLPFSKTIFNQGKCPRCSAQN